MLLSLDGYSSDCRPVRGCVIARRIGGTGGVAECPSHAAPPPVPGSPMTAGAVPPAMRGMITSAAFRLSDRNKRCTMVCCGGPNFFGGVFGEATEDCQRGQTRLGRQPALDVRAVRIENRWHSDALFIWLVHAPMDDALLPQMHIIAEPLRERCCVHCRCRWAGCCRELTRAGADARAKLRLSVPHLSQQSHRIERAINLSKTPLDGLAQFRVR